jgi:two-component system LytT family response regulator
VNRFRVLVAEDEPDARSMVVSLLGRDAEVELVANCADGRTAVEALDRQGIDIAFLDIEMPESSGLQVARHGPGDGPVVVFVTAFGRYAPTAFDVNAVDYVLKPFSDERFFAALERAKKRVRERRLSALADQIATVSSELKHGDATASSGHLTRLAFKDGDRTIVLNTADIVWIEAEDYYVLLHSRRGRHMIRATLASLEDRLDPQVFVRVHRAAIVNVNEVREARDAERLLLVLSNGSQVPVSRSRRRHVETLVLPRLH